MENIKATCLEKETKGKENSKIKTLNLTNALYHHISMLLLGNNKLGRIPL